MKPATFSVLAALIVAAPAALCAPAFAAETISVAPFKAIELHGGGHAILRHGDTQRVTLIKGDRKVARIEVDGDGTLNLSPCSGMCWGNYALEVEVVTPAIAAVSVHGGGDLEAAGTFPRQPSLSVSVHGGGEADLRAIPAEAVSANVHGGGEAEVRAGKSLKASVHGGGTLRYWGHPSVQSDIHGGGSISSGG